MLYLKEKKEVRFFEITKIEEIEIERVLKTILKKYDNIISRRANDIGNCKIIEHVIRLLNETPIVSKQDY